jgi:hypothetical protein
MTRTSPGSSSTQRERIYNLLVCAQGEWVPLLEIAAIAAQYNARVFELRRLGFLIENRTKEVDGVRHSWFRLVSAPVQSQSSPSPARAHREETLSLFRTGDR